MQKVSLYAGLLLLVLAVVAGYLIQTTQPAQAPDDAPVETSLQTFSSEQDFREYLQRSRDRTYRSPQVGSTTTTATRDTVATDSDFQAAEGGTGGSAGTPDRYSTTNVQVEGIDEPDIVKNNGDTVFYSRSQYRAGNTSFIDPRPVENMSVMSNIDTHGELLLANDTLVVLGREKIHSYDISDPKAPSKNWEREYNGSIQSARLYDGSVYMVMREDIDHDSPCPVRPLAGPERDVIVPCSSIHHPPEPIETDVTYTALHVDPVSGEVGGETSFVGSRSNSVVYMSTNALYVTYTEETSEASILLQFMDEHGESLLDDATYDRIKKIQEYDISERAKMVELEVILEEYQQQLDKDERLTFENRLEDRFGNFTRKHMREFQQTGIVKIGLDSDLAVTAEGTVPGRPLNQFSLDEHEGNLRVATTVDPIRGRTASENDVYVLNDRLQTVGSVTGMGVTEEVYSVRFMGDRGYVVTFRRIDPFHVLDLSEPSSPELKGELKLPGFSSYLHPLGEDRILGVGKENFNVKAVIFNVSDPSNPTVEDDYILEESWSDISDTHHAFLLDEKHSVFFLPGSRGGYIFSYDDGLELERAVEMDRAKRAIYIDDYLYVLGMQEVVVLDETTWKRVKSLQLPEIKDYRHYWGEPRIVEPGR
jgi:uncharacterized secreted protein with C-terminal beta-propeller domain